MHPLSKLTVFLCCAWAISLLYGEMIAFWVPLWLCSWPSPPQSILHRSSLTRGGKISPGYQVKVAVLADPQLTDRTSLGLAPKSLSLEAVQFYTDLYMQRSFRSSILPFKPDLILFLGDHFDGGPFLSDEEWQESLRRFKHIFDLNHRGNSAQTIEVRYLSGNHDIGYTGFHSLHPEVIGRYEKEFGERNYRFTIATMEFIVVDAQTLDGPLLSDLTSTTWNFLKNVSKDVALYPRVLLTHIPLYRPDGTPCGPYRSSPIINQRVSWAHPDQRIMANPVHKTPAIAGSGEGQKYTALTLHAERLFPRFEPMIFRYQNYLSENTSSLLLDMIRPILVLSGHDHDHCTVTHRTSTGPVTEHTLGTLSWQQGNLYPSFMLLSATDVGFSNTTNQEDAVSIHLCFLPMQTHIYMWYLFLFIATLLLLLLWPTSGLGCCHYYSCFMDFIGRAIRDNFKIGSKEKDEDDCCDYEMVWDAEGSVHLVKKPLKKAPVKSSTDMGLSGRSNAVVRPAAKKHAAQELEASCAVEMTTEVHPGEIGKVPRFNKSKTRMVLQRFIRMLQLLTVVAAVNVPLYMMLLFKDWIDQ